jgi:hypothetical protein
MPVRLRSVVLLTLLAVFFFNVCVFGLAFSAQLYFHQQAQLDKIKNKKHKDVMELRIPRMLVEQRNTQFQWKKSWEFCWLGEMYDIEDSHLENGEWVFSVKHDTQEDILRKKMERTAEDHTNKRNSQSKKNLKCGSEYFEHFGFVIISIQHVPQFSMGTAPALLLAHSALPDPPPWAA